MSTTTKNKSPKEANKGISMDTVAVKVNEYFINSRILSIAKTIQIKKAHTAVSKASGKEYSYLSVIVNNEIGVKVFPSMFDDCPGKTVITKKGINYAVLPVMEMELEAPTVLVNNYSSERGKKGYLYSLNKYTAWSLDTKLTRAEILSSGLTPFALMEIKSGVLHPEMRLNFRQLN